MKRKILCAVFIASFIMCIQRTAHGQLNPGCGPVTLTLTDITASTLHLTGLTLGSLWASGTSYFDALVHFNAGLTGTTATFTQSVSIGDSLAVTVGLTAATGTINALHVPTALWASGPVYSSGTANMGVTTVTTLGGTSATFTAGVKVGTDLTVTRNLEVDGKANVDDDFTVYGGVGAGGATITGVGEIDAYDHIWAGSSASATRLFISNVERITAAGHGVLDSASVTTEIGAASGTFGGGWGSTGCSFNTIGDIYCNGAAYIGAGAEFGGSATFTHSVSAGDYFIGDGSKLTGVSGAAWPTLQDVLDGGNTAATTTAIGMSLTASDTFNTLDIVHNLGTGQALTVNSYASDTAFATFTVGIYGKGLDGGTGSSGLVDIQSWTGGDIFRIWNHSNIGGNPLDIYNYVGSKINSIDRYGGMSVGGDIINSMFQIHNADGSGRGDIHIRNSSTSAAGPRITKIDESFQVGIATGTIITTDKTNAYIYDLSGIIGGGNTRTYFKNDKLIMSKFADDVNHPSMLLSWDFADGDASTWTTYFAMDSYNRRVYAQQPFHATAGAYFGSNTTYVGNVPAVGYLTNSIGTQPLIQAGVATINILGTSVAVTFSPAFPTALISTGCSCGGENQVCFVTATGTTGFTANIPVAAVSDCEVNWWAVGR